MLVVLTQQQNKNFHLRTFGVPRDGPLPHILFREVIKDSYLFILHVG